MKKIFIVIIASLGLLIPCSCKDLVLFVDCDKCFSEKPTVAVLNIKVTINAENKNVPIIIYQGDIEESNIIEQDTISYSNYQIGVSIGEYYSVLVRYQSKGRTIYAVDGKKPRTRIDNNSCDNQCYIILGDELDARLKF